jgi:hypothetical protein
MVVVTVVVLNKKLVLASTLVLVVTVVDVEITTTVPSDVVRA